MRSFLYCLAALVAVAIVVRETCFAAVNPVSVATSHFRGSTARREAVAKDRGVRVYIYEELVLDKRCSVCLHYDCTSPVLYAKLAADPNRVFNGSEADVFYIPFNLQGSYYAGLCRGLTHGDRVESVLRFLERSPFFRRSAGADHFWDVLYYQLSANDPCCAPFLRDTAISGLLRHIVFGHYIRMTSAGMAPLAKVDPAWRKREWKTTEWSWVRWGRPGGQYMWARTVLVPILPKHFQQDQSFNEWMARPNLFFYRGGGRDCRFHQQRALFMNITAAHSLPRSTFYRSYAPTLAQYRSELAMHKFCIVIRCDDLETSRFIDAVAMNCIPVTLSDGWRLAVAPFWDRLNYDAFTFNIPQTMFVSDPLGALNFVASQPEGVVRRMFSALQKARQALVWNHPASQTHRYVLDEAHSNAHMKVVAEKRIFLIWTTKAEDFDYRAMLALVSLFLFHPNARVELFSNTLPPDFVLPFLRLGCKLFVSPYTLAGLLQGTPLEAWARNETTWATGPFWYTHKTDAMRMALLYRYGGCYVDTDFWAINPLPFGNALVLQQTGPPVDVGSCFMCFEAAHPALARAMEHAAAVYIRERHLYTCIGPRTFTWLYHQLDATTSADMRAGNVRIIPPNAVFPFDASAAGLKLGFVDGNGAKWNRTSALGVHLWNKLSHTLQARKKSIVHQIATSLLSQWMSSFADHNLTFFKQFSGAWESQTGRIDFKNVS